MESYDLRLILNCYNCIIGSFFVGCKYYLQFDVIYYYFFKVEKWVSSISNKLNLNQVIRMAIIGRLQVPLQYVIFAIKVIINRNTKVQSKHKMTVLISVSICVIQSTQWCESILIQMGKNKSDFIIQNLLQQ